MTNAQYKALRYALMIEERLTSEGKKTRWFSHWPATIRSTTIFAAREKGYLETTAKKSTSIVDGRKVTKAVIHWRVTKKGRAAHDKISMEEEVCPSG
jgi:hypothetical protein